MDVMYKSITKKYLETTFYSYIELLRQKFVLNRCSNVKFAMRGERLPKRINHLYGKTEWVELEGINAIFFQGIIVLQLVNGKEMEAYKVTIRMGQTPTGNPQCQLRHSVELIRSLERFQFSPLFLSVVEDTFGMAENE